MFKKINSLFLRLRNNRARKNEMKRKEILATLPQNSFAKKLYSHENLNIEIGLLKIGSKVINISKTRNKRTVSLDLDLLNRLSKTEDLRKAIFIHTHILGNVNRPKSANFSPMDFLTFIDYCHKFGISKFELTLLNKNLIEMGRIQIIFSPEFIEAIQKGDIEKIKNWARSLAYKQAMSPNKVSIIEELKKQNTQIKYVSLNGYKLEEINNVPYISKSR